MRKPVFKFILFCLTLGGFLWSASAFCTTPTHTSWEPSSLISGNGYQLAKTWFLPDWQSDTRSYNTNVGNNVDEENSGGDVEKTCETYGFASPDSIDLSLYDCTDYDIKPLYGLECYTGCVCKSKFQYDDDNCSGNYTPSGTSCGGKYEDCVCKNEFWYTTANCSGEYEPSGSYCGGKYNDCTMRSECMVTSRSCPYGCSFYNDCDKCVECAENPDCDVSPVSCTYGCASTNSCDICISCASNPDCDVESKYCSYGCASYNSCQKCVACEEEPACTYSLTASDCSAECRSVGSSSCVQDGTTYYASCGASTCGSGQSCSNGTCVDDCTPLNDEENCSWGSKSCSDNCGGYRNCCKTASEYCTESGYSSGATCDKGQTAETCAADSGYKKCTGAGCPASQTCTYGCKTYSSQSGCSDVCTACYDDNCHNQTAVSVPANASCSAYYDDCSSKCSSWTCNDNYYQSGNSCKHIDCMATPVSVPTNASCSNTNSCGICTAWNCDSGYYQSGNSCYEDVYVVSGEGFVGTITPDPNYDWGFSIVEGSCVCVYSDGTEKWTQLTLHGMDEALGIESEFNAYCIMQVCGL